jgi:predicted oxidoreductase
MKRISLQRGQSISQVAAGMMRIVSENVSNQDLALLIHRALDAGITTFDLAAIYGGELHKCERAFGDVLEKEPALRKSMEIVTKFGIYPFYYEDGRRSSMYDYSARAIRASIEDSLSSLHTTHIDLALIHRPSPLADPAEIADVLQALVKEGKILSVGVSNHTPAQMRALQGYLPFLLVANQVQISAMNPQCLFDGTIDYAFETKSLLMAWSPLGGGRLEENASLIKVLSKIGGKYGVVLPMILVAWIAMLPARIAIITGTMKPDRLLEAVQGCEIKLTTQEWFEVLEAARGYRVP